MQTTEQRLVNEYLRELEQELRALPRSRQAELLEEVRGHIEAALAELEGPTRFDVLAVLERLGDPADIATEARERFGVSRARAGLLEVGALLLLPLGGLVLPALGWLAGVILLWSSNAWNRRDKLIGTLVIPGGLALPVFALFWVPAETHSGGGRYDKTGAVISRTPESSSGLSSAGQALYLGAVVAGIVLALASAVYLAVRLRRATA